jgi:hypothetical protein
MANRRQKGGKGMSEYTMEQLDTLIEDCTDMLLAVLESEESADDKVAALLNKCADFEHNEVFLTAVIMQLVALHEVCVRTKRFPPRGLSSALTRLRHQESQG